MSNQGPWKVSWFNEQELSAPPHIHQKSVYIPKMTSRRWLVKQYHVKDKVVVGISTIFCLAMLYGTYLAILSENEVVATPRIAAIEVTSGRYWGIKDWPAPRIDPGKSWSQCHQDSSQLTPSQLAEAQCDNMEHLMANTETTEPIHQPIFTPSMGSNFSNLLELPCPPYLRNYRNPCWKEYVDSSHPYENNLYWKVVDEYFVKAQAQWEERWKHGKNWRLRCLPHFFLVGPPKTGTTDLFSKIVNHPHIRQSAKKEPNWWTITRFKEDSLVSLTQYIDLYDMAAQNILETAVPAPGCNNAFHPGIVGDFSTWTFATYFHWYKLPENQLSSDGPRYTTAHYIRHLIPHAKIIFMLRNPADRLYSAYNFYEIGNEFGIKTPQAFHEWVVTYIEIFNACLRQEEFRACAYNMFGKQLTAGIYFLFIQDWLSVFPREQIHFIHLESEYSVKPIETLENMLDFLGVGPIPQLTLSKLEFDSRKNTALYPSMLPETRELLSQFYGPFNDRLAQILKDDRYHWGYEPEGSEHVEPPLPAPVPAN